MKKSERALDEMHCDQLVIAGGGVNVVICAAVNTTGTELAANA